MKPNWNLVIEFAYWEKVDEAWKDIKKPLTVFLKQRVATIQKQYENNLNDEQMVRVLREEKFVSECCDFLDDTESYVILYREMVKSLQQQLANEKEDKAYVYQDLSKQIDQNIKLIDALMKLGQPGYKELRNILISDHERNKKNTTIR